MCITWCAYVLEIKLLVQFKENECIFTCILMNEGVCKKLRNLNCETVTSILRLLPQIS